MPWKQQQYTHFFTKSDNISDICDIGQNYSQLSVMTNQISNLTEQSFPEGKSEP